MNLGTRGWARSVQNLLARFIVSNPNQTTPVLEIAPAENAAANIDVVISPKGNASFSLATADGTLQGGNKRGAGAVDLQIGPTGATRTATTQVASGQVSFAGGARNQASGLYSFAFGLGNVSSGTSSITFGSTSTASASDTVVIGNGSIASAASAHCYGDSISSNGASAIGIGTRLVASGIGSIAIGQWASTRTIAGFHAYGASDNTYGVGTIGYVQSGLLLHTITTTDATATRLTSNNGAASTTNQIILPNTSAYYFRGYVIATNSGGTVSKGWNIEGVIRRGANAAATAIVGTASVTSSFADAGASTWTLAVAADTTNGGLAITATGQAATTIRWNAEVRTTEVVHP